jgi:hypothetical protein
MALLRSLVPWLRLTRSGIPEMRVARRALVTSGVEIAVGDILPVNALCHRSRIRQLYEQRLLEPVVASVGGRQSARVMPTAPVFTPVVSVPIPVAKQAAMDYTPGYRPHKRSTSR